MKFACFPLTLLGLTVSGYLLQRSFSLVESPLGEGGDVCSAIFGVGCDATLQSQFSHQLGIPLAGWGVVYYGTLIALLLMGWLLETALDFEATLTALVLAVFAALASIGLASTMLLGVVSFCPLCGLLQVINLFLVPALALRAGRSLGQLLKALTAGVHYILRGKGDDATAPCKVVGLLACAMVGVILYQWIMIQETLGLQRAGKTSLLQTLSEFGSGPMVEIPVNADDPRRGEVDSPIRLIVFSDLRCPSCRRFAQTMDKLSVHFGEELVIVFKHFPLENTCNRLAQRKLNAGACQAAWAAEAAHRQGEFWGFHNAMFRYRGTRSDGAITAIVKQNGLDIERFNGDLDSEQVKGKVLSDVELGIRLGVDATPTIFLNGRRVRDIRFDTLLFLMTDELAQTEPGAQQEEAKQRAGN